ncbi:MEDS domain-containing protein [Peribacillus sp. NPDC096622]|uniref:MEDS domain-containing protein n=1 Tax=Peribacillus sp. NPDC096622 TaxID=3364396 RepID=UPI00380FD116
MFEDQKNVHVLYSYTEMENYIKQVLSYIQDGIMAGDHVILVENDRIYPLIHKELSTRLTKDQMELLHFVNNFDFYCSRGSYHPPVIEEYFNKTVQPYVENKISFRSWAHVEWATLEEPLHIIEEFERTVDKAVNLLSFPLICALLVSFGVLLVNSGHLLVSTHFTPHKKRSTITALPFFRN